MERVFGLISGQYAQSLLAEVKADEKYDDTADNSDMVWLLTTIKSISARVDSRANKVFTYHEKLMDFITIQ